jgi:molybdenum cofactor guanylyltransferase
VEQATGILLLGGASSRFGSPKALARIDDETLAERAWRTLGKVCEQRLALGKAADGLPLPFPVLDDGNSERAAIHGLAAGLRAASTDLVIALPVDCPAITAEALLALVDGCKDSDAAVPHAGPLPGVFRKRALAALESGELSIRRSLEQLEVAVVTLDPALLLNVNTPADLLRLR